ncbi:MAG: cell wall assembly regulator SMI1 [Verrucomicrobiales bacterium]
MKTVSELTLEMIRLIKPLSPETARSFNPPSNLKAIANLSSLIQAEIPIDLASFWMTFDGQDLNSSGVYDDDFLFLPVDGAADEWEFSTDFFEKEDKTNWNECLSDSGVASVFWSKGWLPFAWSPDGSVLCADLQPAVGGKKGQIIMNPISENHIYLLAPSFHHWLHELVMELQSGRFKTDASSGFLEYERKH